MILKYKKFHTLSIYQKEWKTKQTRPDFVPLVGGQFIHMNCYPMHMKCHRIHMKCRLIHMKHHLIRFIQFLNYA